MMFSICYKGFFLRYEKKNVGKRRLLFFFSDTKTSEQDFKADGCHTCHNLSYYCYGQRILDSGGKVSRFAMFLLRIWAMRLGILVQVYHD
jgi:ribosomal protein L31